jgi:FkbM family methyltransferase
LILTGNFEVSECDFVWRFLRPGDVFVDVGANIGLFTLVAGRRVGQEGRVYAFEPVRGTWERLTENVTLNELRHVTCEQLALSDAGGAADMVTSTVGNDAWNSLAPRPTADGWTREAVQCVTWDSYAKGNGLEGHVALMKVDVEGWEKHALLGGGDMFRRPDAPVLLVEFTEENAQHAGGSCRELFGLLRSFGFGLYYYDRGRRSLRAASVDDSFGYVNLVATKDAKSVCNRLGRRWARQSNFGGSA